MTNHDLAKEEIKNFLKKHFSNRDYFSVIYGSYAYGTQRPDSDLDLIICAREKEKDDVSVCVDFIKKIHEKYHLGLDYEITYEKKLVVDYKFLKKTVEGVGFLNQQNQFYIPKIIKTRRYLNSEELLYRFFLDSMVHKHVFLLGNIEDYSKFRNFAVENLVRIIIKSKKLEKITVNLLVDEFIFNGEVSGDYYLGFEDKFYYRYYLTSVFEKLLKELAEKKILLLDNYDCFRFRKDWLDKKPTFKL